jgi:hypothetical protein
MLLLGLYPKAAARGSTHRLPFSGLSLDQSGLLAEEGE